MTLPEYTMLQCSNTNCNLRFPLPISAERLPPCPMCGGTLNIVNHPFKNQKPTSPSTYPQLPELHLFLDNIRSAFNVGSILRTADAVAVAHIYLGGITPTPDNPKVEKTALGAEFSIPWDSCPNGVHTIKTLRASGFNLWALEGGMEAVSIFDTSICLPETQPTVLIIGSEIAGIDPEILQLCHKTMYIPMIGFKRSLNVASAFSIAVYTLRYQLNF